MNNIQKAKRVSCKKFKSWLADYPGPLQTEATKEQLLWFDVPYDINCKPIIDSKDRFLVCCIRKGWLGRKKYYIYP